MAKHLYSIPLGNNLCGFDRLKIKTKKVCECLTPHFSRPVVGVIHSYSSVYKAAVHSTFRVYLSHTHTQKKLTSHISVSLALGRGYYKEGADFQDSLFS